MSEQITEQLRKNKPSLRKPILVAGIVGLLFITVLVFSLFEKPESDPASEVVIRREAAKLFNRDHGDMTQEDFAQIHSITLGEGLYASAANQIELCDIKFLENFTGLEWLCLGKISYPVNKIPKSMILLDKIGIIDIREKYILDLSPLGNLNKLRTLNIVNMSVKNIEPLSSLTNLENLFIVNTNIRSIEPLRNSVNLQELIINGSDISDLRPLMGLKKLKILNIKSCKNINNEQVEDLQKVLPDLRIQR